MIVSENCTVCRLQRSDFNPGVKPCKENLTVDGLTTEASRMSDLSEVVIFAGEIIKDRETC